MAKGYWIAHVDVTDPEAYKKYVAANAEAGLFYGVQPLIQLAKGRARRWPAVRIEDKPALPVRPAVHGRDVVGALRPADQRRSQFRLARVPGRLEQDQRPSDAPREPRAAERIEQRRPDHVAGDAELPADEIQHPISTPSHLITGPVHPRPRNRTERIRHKPLRGRRRMIQIAPGDPVTTGIQLTGNPHRHRP